jgi:hypothetical protein
MFEASKRRDASPGFPKRRRRKKTGMCGADYAERRRGRYPATTVPSANPSKETQVGSGAATNAEVVESEKLK